MIHKIPVYLRKFRRQWALTQLELAKLLGIKSPQHLSRLENSKRTPGLSVLLSSEVIFGKRFKEIFPKLYAETQAKVVENLRDLREDLIEVNTKAAEKKLELIDEALERAAITSTNQMEYDA